MPSSEPTHPRLDDGAIHVWLVPLETLCRSGGRLGAGLDAQERLRASRLACPHVRDRFLASRTALRAILGRYLPRAGDRPQFRHGLHGKPALANAPELQFNLSRSGDYALVAVARGASVGVDLEAIRPGLPGLDQVAQLFAPAEQEALAALPSERRARALFHCWVSKEAYAKGCGCGLAPPLHAFEVAVDPDGPAALHRPYAHLADGAPWSLHRLPCPRDHVAVLATDCAAPTIRTFRWEPPGIRTGWTFRAGNAGAPRAVPRAGFPQGTHPGLSRPYHP